MTCSDEDRGRSRRLGAEDRGWSHILGGQTLERPVFAGLTSKPVATVSPGLTLKPMATVSPGLASKLALGFLVEPQNQDGGRFSSLCLKTGSSYLMI
jgi:hypothetical protein